MDIEVNVYLINENGKVNIIFTNHLILVELDWILQY